MRIHKKTSMAIALYFTLSLVGSEERSPKFSVCTNFSDNMYTFKDI
ncbi:MAG: hypothetical protein PUP90_31825 [Nostoc sp. S4]|nr:hypothetical protein [Nostoc sp. S4]